MITVSISWSSFRFMWAIWYSYSKSEIARIPRTRMCASFTRAKSTSRPWNDVTSTFPIVEVSRFSIRTRSAGVKKAFFRRFTATATITREKTREDRSMMSRCPFVGGSNEPG